MAEFKEILRLERVDESGNVLQTKDIDLRRGIIGEAAPTENTPGMTGLPYYVVRDGKITAEYVCMAAEKGVYTWKKRESGTGGVTEETDPTVPSWAKQAQKPTYTASEVGARPDTWMPTAAEIGALPASTKIPGKTSDLTNDSGYITIAVATLLNYYLKTETYAKTETYSQTEVDNLISGLDKRLNAIADSEDVDLDQLSEIVAYIKSNKSLIDSITTSKVNVSDIVDNLTTADSKKPLSAAQGKALKALYDALPAWAKAAEKPTYSKSEVGLGNVDNVRQYSASNPPPYPVRSVNGQTGDVKLDASDVGAVPADTKIPGVDSTLKVSGAAADAKVVGEKFTEVSEAIADQQAQIDGKQPKGNYLTEVPDEYITEDELDAEITDLKAQGVQQTPLFAESLDWLNKNGDTSKVYVLPDGYIYGWILTEVESAPSYENKLPLAVDSSGAIYNGVGYKNGYRLNSSCLEKEESTCGHTGFIAASAGSIFRFKNIPACTVGYGYIHYFKSDKKTSAYSPLSIAGNTFSTDANGVSSYTLPSGIELGFIRFSYGVMSADSIITINEEIVEGGGTTTTYAWANTGRAFVPAEYENRIVDLENSVSALEDALKDVETASDLLYIAPDGNDSNDGLTATTPKKTVAACVSAGATRISAKRGVYAEKIYLTDIGELEIFPTDNAQDYTNNGNWEPIVFDVSDTVAVSGFAAYNSIKRVAYSNANNEQFNKVFVAKSQTPLYGGDYGSRYNSTIWLFSGDEKTICVKLKPVLTVAECESETNTFSYVGGYIYINADWTGVEKVVVPTNWGTGISIAGAQKVILREVEVRFSGAYNLEIKNCAYIDLYKCSAKYTSYASGFHPVNVNGVFNACYATKNYDGFGVNGCGHTTYIDCVSEFNFDDGVSHHAESEGTFIGGRYEGNGKGGNTPAYGAKVNIYGGIYKDNASFGIGYLYASSSGKADGMVQGAVMVGNPVGLSVNANCTVTAIDCKYSGNTSDKDIKGNFTEY